MAGINNEEAQEYGLQLGAKADDSIIGSAKHVLGGGGSGRHCWKRGPTVPSQPIVRVKHTCPVSPDSKRRRRRIDPTEDTGVKLSCNGDYFKK